MKTSKFKVRSNPGFLTICIHCNTSFRSYRQGKKTCSLRCQRQLRARIRQEAASEKLTAEIIGLYRTYRLEQFASSQKIIY